MSSERIAICVATYRRPEGLSRLLKGLAVLTLPKGVSCIVVVVDNDPDESAKSIVLNAVLPCEVCYVHEPARNLSRVRNRSMDAAGEVDRYFFIDDDECPRSDWILRLCAAASRSGATVVNGPVRVWAIERRFERVVSTIFFQRPLYRDGSTDYAVRSTNNAAVDARFVCAHGIRFDEAYGITGGEDTKFFEDMRKAGATFVWAADAEVDEYLDASRITARRMIMRAVRSGETTFQVFRMHSTLAHGYYAVKAAAKWLAASLIAPFWVLWFAHDARRCSYVIFKVLFYVGELRAAVGFSTEEFR